LLKSANRWPAFRETPLKESVPGLVVGGVTQPFDLDKPGLYDEPRGVFLLSILY
jgi:hypothetical protein